MIEGGWPYIWGAYAATLLGIGVLALVIAARLRFWAKRARALDQDKRQ
jgi:heme exporter protein D